MANKTEGGSKVLSRQYARWGYAKLTKLLKDEGCGLDQPLPRCSPIPPELSARRSPLVLPHLSYTRHYSVSHASLDPNCLDTLPSFRHRSHKNGLSSEEDHRHKDIR